jgi:hypothetical protein
LVPGYPGHDELIYFRVQPVRSFCSISSFRLRFPQKVLPFASTAPGTCQDSDSYQQGGCQQANLLARWGKAPSYKLSIFAACASVAGVTIARLHS